MPTVLQIVKIVLGGWVIASPWIFGYEALTSAVISNIAVGGLALLMAIVNLVKIAKHKALYGVADPNRAP